MQMQAQPQQQPNSSAAMQGAMQKAKQPMQPAKAQQPPQATSPNQQAQGDQFTQEIMQNLESHLNSLPPQQKQFLASSLQHYANIVIPVLGIVCGQEVFQYFVQVYKQHFAGQQAQPAQNNSSPSPQGQPQAQPQSQPPAQGQPAQAATPSAAPQQ